jgi:catechol 2,3-dioxygenase-like lactoylglutathione lyase family enzyme
MKPLNKVIGIHHIELNVSDLDTSFNFYFLLSSFFEGGTIEREDMSFCWRLGTFYIYFNQVKRQFKDAPYHRKQVGLDHIAIELSNKEEVLALREFLNRNNIPILYDADYYGPNYFAIYFEDPDRIKLEFGYDEG